MLYAGLGIFGLMLLAVGGYLGLREYRLGKPAPIWVPVPLRVGIPMEDQEALAKKIEDKLRDDALLRQVVIDANLQQGFEQPTEDAALEELKRRLFVKVGTAQTPQGISVPSINVGVDGTRREKKVLEDAAIRMIKDVWRMIGIDPETGRPVNQPSGEIPADTNSETSVPNLN